MQKKVILIILLILGLFVFKPCNIYALENSVDDNSITLISEDSSIQARQSESCNSLLGNPEDEDSVAWLVQKVLNYVKIAGPMLVLGFSCIDFLKLIIQSDADSMTKAQKKLYTRLALAVFLFFVPDLVNVLLSLFGLTTSQTCAFQ